MKPRQMWKELEGSGRFQKAPTWGIMGSKAGGWGPCGNPLNSGCQARSAVRAKL